MANPQAENGHIDIANEIVESLCQINLSAYESRILWALLRKTYGWHKKEDAISLSQFNSLTNISIQHVNRSIKQLENRNIIIVTRYGKGRLNHYQFQKDYTLWLDNNLQPIPIQAIPKEAIPKEAIPIQAITYTDSGNKPIPIQANTKETIQKKLYKRNIRKENIKRKEVEYDFYGKPIKHHADVKVKGGYTMPEDYENTRHYTMVEDYDK